MTPKTLLILGGSGNAGFSIAHLLLRETPVQLVVAGRRADRARFTAGELNASALTENWEYRVSSLALDTADTAALTAAFAQVDCVVVAASTSHTANIAAALVATGVDCLDIREHPGELAALLAARETLTQAGCCYIAQAGFFPGLPAALVRYLAPGLVALDAVSVNLLTRIDWSQLAVGPSTLREFAHSLHAFESRVYRRGAWRKAAWWRGDYRRVKFNAEFPAVTCAPLAVPEIDGLLECYPSLQKLDFNAAGFNAFVDYLVLPLIRSTQAPPGLRVQKWLNWGLTQFSKPPFGCFLQATLDGRDARRRKRIEATLGHRNGYDLTAIAAVAVLQQYLDGSLKQPGLHYQGLLVEPVRLLAEMQRLGASLTVTEHFF